MSDVERAAAAVDEARLWRRQMGLARFGATARGGVNRQALSAEENEARRWIADWAAGLGLGIAVDPVGNLFVRYEGRDPAAAPVMTGSHIDSQPTGGKFDGAYGVMAGYEVLEALVAAGIRPLRPIVVAAWTNEEGSRFQPGCTGSRAFVGNTPLEALLEERDGAGMRFGDALEATLDATPNARRLPLGFPVHAYVEAHIEQGPILEQQAKTIGAVTSIQGARRYTVEVLGEEAHAGTMPVGQRKDALRAAVRMITALQDLMADPEDVVKFTVGRLECHPGSVNVVPGRVRFTIDFRHPSAAELARRGDLIEPICRALAGGCAVSVAVNALSAPVEFPAGMVDAVEGVSRALGLPTMRLPSGAGHDAGYLSQVCPTGMIFIPCAKGISHNEVEDATPADLAAGARVLAGVLVRLAGE